MPAQIDIETHYRLLNLIERNPDISQRQLAEEMGVSVGKINYCLKALINLGHIKLKNFTHSNSKLGYAYLLTPMAISEKTKVAIKFLEKKQKQYDLIKKEIEEIKDNLTK